MQTEQIKIVQLLQLPPYLLLQGMHENQPTEYSSIINIKYINENTGVTGKSINAVV